MLYFVIGLFLLALFGLPLFTALGAGSLLYAQHSGLDAALLIVELNRLASSPNLSAIPLFTFAGVVLAAGGAPQRLLRLFNAALGWLPGGLAVVAIAACAFFTSFSGASGVTILALGGLLFAGLGMICTALVPGIETFNLPIFLGITPMFLFSGTFFPLQNLPGWAQQLAQLLPLTHLVKLVRGCSLQLWSGDLWLSLLYLLVGVLLLLPLAIALMVRRIVV